jgi:hypothetical protein
MNPLGSLPKSSKSFKSHHILLPSITASSTLHLNTVSKDKIWSFCYKSGNKKWPKNTKNPIKKYLLSLKAQKNISSLMTRM